MSESCSSRCLFKSGDIKIHTYLSVSYDERHPCQEGSNCCDNDYCRCGEISNVKVLKPINIIHECLSLNDGFFLERILSHFKLYSPDTYEGHPESGYYGDELGEITIKNKEKVIAVLDEFYKCETLRSKVEFILELEYERIASNVVGRRWYKKTVSISDIDLGNHVHYKKCDLVERYVDYPFPRCILVEENERYRLVDGYHRLKAVSGKSDTVLAYVGK